MRINQVETFPLLYPLPKAYGDSNGYKKYRSSFLIRIVTESGIDGWGECIDWLPALQIGFTQRIIPFLIGRSVLYRTETVQIISKWHQRAAAAVSMALTEIIAKSSKLHICELWGGRMRNHVPVYASFQSYSESNDWKNNSCQMIEQAAHEGFTQIKIKIGGRSIQEDQQHVSMIQAEWHNTMQIILDANQSYDVSTTSQWSGLIGKWNNILWLEEPIPFHLADEYRLLRTLLPTALAGGENIKDAAAFLPLLNHRALDIIQPDPMHHTSIDKYRETLELARSFGFRVSPHCFDGGLARLYALFAQACLNPWSKMNMSSIESVEWDVMDNPFTGIVPIKPIHGEVAIPQGIGTGLEPDMELIQAYLWDGSSYVE